MRQNNFRGRISDIDSFVFEFARVEGLYATHGLDNVRDLIPLQPGQILGALDISNVKLRKDKVHRH